jgi:sec-independent protein translocase protein TatC
MTMNQFYIAIGILVFLIATPLLVLVMVRIFIRDQPEELTPAEESVLESFETLGDFWAGIAPHLLELRNRLVKALLAVAIGTALGFWIVNTPTLLGAPLPELLARQFAAGYELQGIGVAEPFVNYMKIALVVGIAFSMPVVVYQVVAFFIPGLLPHEKRILFTSLPFVTELFLAGLAFGWFFTVPAAINFLLGFGQTEHIVARPSFESFISIVSRLLLWNGLVFELPAIIYLLARLRIVNAKMLGRTRRYAIVVITVAAALITPTGDPFNLLLLAVPMYLLYELGILLARFVPQPAEAPGEAAKVV